MVSDKVLAFCAESGMMVEDRVSDHTFSYDGKSLALQFTHWRYFTENDDEQEEKNIQSLENCDVLHELGHFVCGTEFTRSLPEYGCSFGIAAPLEPEFLKDYTEETGINDDGFLKFNEQLMQEYYAQAFSVHHGIRLGVEFRMTEYGWPGPQPDWKGYWLLKREEMSLTFLDEDPTIDDILRETQFAMDHYSKRFFESLEGKKS